MNVAEYRVRQDRAVTTTVATVCGVGLAGGLLPAVEHALTAAASAAAAVAVLVGLVRWALRRLRERREATVDALAAIAWRAAHLPPEHPLRVRDRHERTGGAATRVGVA